MSSRCSRRKCQPSGPKWGEVLPLQPDNKDLIQLALLHQWAACKLAVTEWATDTAEYTLSHLETYARRRRVTPTLRFTHTHTHTHTPLMHTVTSCRLTHIPAPYYKLNSFSSILPSPPLPPPTPVTCPLRYCPFSPHHFTRLAQRSSVLAENCHSKSLFSVRHASAPSWVLFL